VGAVHSIKRGPPTDRLCDTGRGGLKSWPRIEEPIAA